MDLKNRGQTVSVSQDKFSCKVHVPLWD